MSNVNRLDAKKFRKHQWEWVKCSHGASFKACVLCGATATPVYVAGIGRRQHFHIAGRYSSIRRAPRCNSILTLTP